MSSDKEQPVSIWDIPSFPQTKVETDSTNAMGYQSGQMAPPEVEMEPEPEPLTAQDLENIRQAAYEEGLDQGLEEGTRQGLEKGRLQGLKEGHEEGLKQGVEQGLVEGSEQIRQQVTRWESLLLPLTQPLRELDHQVAEQLIVLVTDLCQQLLKVELVLNEQLFLQLLNEAIDTLPKGQTSLEIKLHPDDLVLVQSHYSNEEQEKRGWLLCSEPTLKSGVCEVNTELSSVRNDIHSRMQSLINDFIAKNSQLEPAVELSNFSDEQEDPQSDVKNSLETVAKPLSEPVQNEQQNKQNPEPQLEPDFEISSQAEEKKPAPEPLLDPELIPNSPESEQRQEPSTENPPNSVTDTVVNPDEQSAS